MKIRDTMPQDGPSLVNDEQKADILSYIMSVTGMPAGNEELKADIRALDTIKIAKKTTWDGVFTAAQAKRGNDAYQASCSGCHGSDLRATDAEAVDLTGPAIRAKWNGKTLEDRFETIRDTMPLGNANTLGDKTYMDILAFILQFNDFPPGNQELVPQTAKVIVFVPRP